MGARVLGRAWAEGSLSRGTLGAGLEAEGMGLEVVVLVCLLEGFWVSEKCDLLSLADWLWDGREVLT